MSLYAFDGQQPQGDAFRLLESLLPVTWIPRKIAGRNKSLEILLEIIDEDGTLAGQTALIRLIAMQKGIPWNIEGQHSLQIPIRNFDFCKISSGPGFIFLADLKSHELFFLSRDYFIKRHFAAYLKSGSFHYFFRRNSDRFDAEKGPEFLAQHLEAHTRRQEFEHELVMFLTGLSRNDLANGLSRTDIFQRSFHFLCDYFHLSKLPQDRYKPWSRQIAGFDRDDTENEKQDDAIRAKELEILLHIEPLLKAELSHWSLTKPRIYYFVYSLTQRALAERSGWL